MSFNKLKNFQKGLKELKHKELVKLRKSIITNGIVSPFYVWRDGEDLWLLDGMQRLKVIKLLVNEGFLLDGVPIVFVKAKNLTDAKNIILLLSSRYGKVTDDGLVEFISMEMIKNGVVETVNIPEIKVEDIILDVEDMLGDGNAKSRGKSKRIKCPKCGFEWEE